MITAMTMSGNAGTSRIPDTIRSRRRFPEQYQSALTLSGLSLPMAGIRRPSAIIAASDSMINPLRPARIHLIRGAIQIEIN